MSDDPLDRDPDALAEGLEGVLMSADMALTEEEIQYIGDAIGFLKAEADRRDSIKDKLDDAGAEGSA